MAIERTFTLEICDLAADDMPQETTFVGTIDDVHKACLHYARMRSVEYVSAWDDDNGQRVFHCDNNETQDTPDDTPSIDWNGFNRPGSY